MDRAGAFIISSHWGGGGGGGAEESYNENCTIDVYTGL